MARDQERTRQEYDKAITLVMAFGMILQLGAAGAIVRQMILNPGVHHWGVTTWSLAGPSLFTAMCAIALLCFRSRRPWVWGCVLVSCVIGAGILAVDRTGQLVEYERWIKDGMR